MKSTGQGRWFFRVYLKITFCGGDEKMPRKFLVLLTVLIVLSILLAACASQGGGGAAPTDVAVVPTETPRPTSTATPEPTATSTPEPTLTPTATFTPTPTEMPLPAEWQAYVKANEDVIVKTVDGVPALVGTMSNGNEVAVAKYDKETQQWISETSMEPFRNDDGTFNLEDALRLRVLIPEYDAATDSKAPSKEDRARAYAVALEAWEQMKGSFSGTPTEFNTFDNNAPMYVNKGLKMYMKFEGENLNDLKILFVSSVGNGARLYIVSTSEGPLPLLRLKNLGFVYGGGTIPSPITNLKPGE
ncbi:MAG TPA: hypothetical protein PKW33_11730 [Anaerolineaceae bacterium]|nr:hypothetical protein [Anaerolineaceae bacterium]HPN52249.1 hypothetical protein [Anaerolineaceae bacterium]